MSRTVLYLNHSTKTCGVYQYGLAVFNIISKSKKYNFVYRETDSFDDYQDVLKEQSWSGIVYNYIRDTMPWLNAVNLQRFLPNWFLYHDGGAIFDIDEKFIINSNPGDIYSGTMYGRGIPRPLKEHMLLPKNPVRDIPVISSFGFGFHHKCFPDIIELVQSQLDDAIIRMVITNAFFGDRDGTITRAIASNLFKLVRKPGIKLDIRTSYMEEDELLLFLNDSDLNIFCYKPNDIHIASGISSVIDYALSVNTNIAITKCCMFRHIYHGDIDVNITPLKQIMHGPTDHFDNLRVKWCNNNLLTTFENIIDTSI